MVNIQQETTVMEWDDYVALAAEAVRNDMSDGGTAATDQLSKRLEGRILRVNGTSHVLCREKEKGRIVGVDVAPNDVFLHGTRITVIGGITAQIGRCLDYWDGVELGNVLTVEAEFSVPGESVWNIPAVQLVRVGAEKCYLDEGFVRAWPEGRPPKDLHR